MNKYLIFAIVSFFISCVNDDIPPVVDSFSLDMSDTIRNVFSVELNATDKSGVNRIELYVNDSLVTESDRVPFEYSWNTLKIDDGNYQVKVILYDSEGNRTEKLSDVVVNNCLLRFNSFLANDRTLLAVSDEEGNLLDTISFAGKGIRELKAEKPFNGDAVNILYCRTGTYPYMFGYIHVKRGSELRLGESIIFDPEKYIRLHIRNDIPSFTEIIIGTDRAYYTLNSMADTVTLPQYIPYTPGHKLLIQLKTNEGRYYRVVDINEALELHEITIKLSTVLTPEVHKVMTLPSTGNATCCIIGRVRDDDTWKTYTIFTGEYRPSVEMWYVNEYFYRYTTQIWFWPQNSNVSYIDEYNGAIPESFVPLDVDFQIPNASLSEFSGNPTGSFDICVAGFRNSDRMIQCYIFAPESRCSWKLPDPGVIFNDKRFNLNNFHIEEVSLDKFESIDFSTGYYDLSVDISTLHTFDPHNQSKRIKIPF